VSKERPVNTLTVKDLRMNPVWKFTNRETSDETAVKPARRLPVSTLDGHVVGTQVRLANGARKWAMLSNLDVHYTHLTEHFLTLSIFHRRQWFHLARYHDFDRRECGPEALCRFLGLKLAEVFPLSYDVRKYVRGAPSAGAGQIRAKPRRKLTHAEIIASAVH